MLGVDKLRGSMPPLVTPFSAGRLDERAYAKLVDFQISQGSHGVLVNGTTAEPSTLTVAERNRLVDVAVETAGRRIPVVAATGSQSMAETQALTTHAVRAGVDALLIVTPYYIRPPQRGLIEFLLEVTKHHETPWMVYHIPGRTAVSVTIDTMATLRDRSKTFVGIKHASNDLGFVSECLMKLGSDFRVFVGLEELSFPMMTIGACGLMNAVGNILPRSLAALCEAVWTSDIAAARSIHDQLFELNKSIFFDTNPIPIKYMMKRLGLLVRDEHRLPMSPATPDLAKQLDDVLRRHGLLDGGGTAGRRASFERNNRAPRKAVSVGSSD